MLNRVPFFFGGLTPGNDSICGILSLFIETLIYGFIVVFVVVFLLIVTLSFFSMDYPGKTEEYPFIRHRSLRTEKLRLQYKLQFNYTNEPETVDSLDQKPVVYRTFPEYFSTKEESLLDVIFLTFPTLVVIFILIPTLGFLYSAEYALEHLHTSMSINVIGHQWYWTYEYCLGANNAEFDCSHDSVLNIECIDNAYLEVDKRLIIPVDTIISISLTSTDVIHSWAVPQLGIKVDCVPGRMSNSILHSFTIGVFYGQCSELCGVLHGFMPICVESVPQELFFYWVSLHNIDSVEQLIVFIHEHIINRIHRYLW